MATFYKLAKPFELLCKKNFPLDGRNLTGKIILTTSPFGSVANPDETPAPHKGQWKFWGARGSQISKILKQVMKLKCVLRKVSILKQKTNLETERVIRSSMRFKLTLMIPLEDHTAITCATQKSHLETHWSIEFAWRI